MTDDKYYFVTSKLHPKLRLVDGVYGGRYFDDPALIRMHDNQPVYVQVMGGRYDGHGIIRAMLVIYLPYNIK
jgi:hypothetical protein